MFIWSALAHLIALTSPGPDTAVVLRQVSLYGRKEGYKTSIGIGIGIYIHCVLAVNGISLIIISNDLYKFMISLVGGAYILFLGISMLKSDLREVPVVQNKSLENANSILNGLITNIFNVKAFLFFVSLFAVLIDGLSSFYFYIYPIYFAITSSLWFTLLSYLTTISTNKSLNIYSNTYIAYIMSITLCLIALFILVRSFYEYF
jgi:threonine/homoserine/homoserine lactone efflux protein|tara:strand:+ start:976 stop:1587 length:612 start_codon:yes stop_codon:yes gene_type:complete